MPTGTPPSPYLQMARLLSTLSLVAIIAAAASFLVAAGWIPWAAPVVLAALGLMVAGFAFRRRRRPGSAATHREAGRAAAATPLAKERGPTALVAHLAASRSEVRKGVAAMRLDPHCADFSSNLPPRPHEADEGGRKLREAGRSARGRAHRHGCGGHDWSASDWRVEEFRTGAC